MGVIHGGLLKYERLPNFCFNCGLIGHRFRTCAEQLPEAMAMTTLPYGAWMGCVTNLLFDQLFSFEPSESPSTPDVGVVPSGPAALLLLPDPAAVSSPNQMVISPTVATLPPIDTGTRSTQLLTPKKRSSTVSDAPPDVQPALNK